MSAIVTGGGSGIGSAVVERLRRAGHDVAAWDLTGGDFTCDVSDPGSATATSDAVIDAFGGIDILVNSAGIVVLAPAEDL